MMRPPDGLLLIVQSRMAQETRRNMLIPFCAPQTDDPEEFGKWTQNPPVILVRALRPV